MRIKQLERLISEANAAYYGDGFPTMTDAAYDALVVELSQLDPHHPLINKIGAEPTSGWAKARHSIPMGSLNKAQEAADLRQWLASCGHKGGEPLVIMDKLDGSSISLRYEDGVFQQAITRGDGLTGEDITKNARLMQGVLDQFGTFSGYIRGEVVCTHEDFDTYFPGQSNPRNTANGTMKRQSENESCQYLTVIAFQVIPDDEPAPSKNEELTLLKRAGFRVPRYEVVSTGAEVELVYNHYIQTQRALSPYDIDGLVIQFDSLNKMERLGEQGRGPKGAIAFKFPHDAKETILKAIQWQVGPSGRVTPVANFEPVQLAGAEVKQASLHTARRVRDLGLFEGCRITATRRNDVIPMVEENLDLGKGEAIEPPSTCPSCLTPLVMDGEYLVCRGDSCPSQVKGAITRWISKVGVLHFGDALVEGLIEAGLLKDIPDLYLLDPKEASEVRLASGRKAGGSATKAIDELRKLMELDLHTIVGSLGIPLVGRSTAKLIVDYGFDTLPKMRAVTRFQLAAIPGMGEARALSFETGMEQHEETLNRLFEVGITIREKVEGLFTGKTVCVTGFRGQAEADLRTEVERQGGSMKNGVSRTLDYLVYSKEGSSKVKKAKDYNSKGASIEIVSLEEMFSKLPVRQ